MKIRNLLSVLLIIFFMSNSLYSRDDQVYAERRAQLMKQINQAVIILSSQTSTMGMNKDFYYLTGIEDPEVILVLTSDGKETLFNKAGIWAYANSSSNSQAFAYSELSQQITRLLSQNKNLFVSFKNLSILSDLGRGMSSLESIKNIDPFIVQMRIYKDEAEIEILKKACLITAQGLNDTFKAIKPGLAEKDPINKCNIATY